VRNVRYVNARKAFIRRRTVKAGRDAVAVDGRPWLAQLPECLTLPELTAFYAAGGSPVKIAEAALARIAEWDDPSLFISRFAEQDVLRRARDLEAEGPRGRALFGAPFVIKDNIDAAGLATTAGCPGYAYRPAENAPAVQRAIDAGAILLGKTNLDQFATGATLMCPGAADWGEGCEPSTP
jgi:Asp-tRNA(Asn)/Glu-tRNA(Gln) amidotransferase A subunit family amidase